MEITAPTSQTQTWIKCIVILAAIGVIGTWLFGTPSGTQGKADAIGYAICHRIPERSLTTYNDRPLPLCARCSGIYSGVALGLGMIFLMGKSRANQLPHWKIGAAFGFFVVVLGIDGINSYLHLFPNFEGGLYEPSNTLRVITGVFCGLTLIHGLFPIFNAGIWREQTPQKAVQNWREFAIYCLGGILLTLALLSGSPFILLVFGLLSALAVLTILTMVNSVAFISLIRRERTYRRWGELWLPFLAGVTVAIILIGGIDAVRLMFTGTWDGFVFTQR